MDTEEKRESGGEKLFREAFAKMLLCPVRDQSQREALEELGVEPSYINLITFSNMKKAAGGDTAAARFIRDTLGQKAEREEGNGGNLFPELLQMSDEQLRALAWGIEKEERGDGDRDDDRD